MCLPRTWELRSEEMHSHRERSWQTAMETATVRIVGERNNSTSLTVSSLGALLFPLLSLPIPMREKELGRVTYLYSVLYC